MVEAPVTISVQHIARRKIPAPIERISFISRSLSAPSAVKCMPTAKHIPTIPSHRHTVDHAMKIKISHLKQCNAWRKPCSCELPSRQNQTRRVVSCRAQGRLQQPATQWATGLKNQRGRITKVIADHLLVGGFTIYTIHGSKSNG